MNPFPIDARNKINNSENAYKQICRLLRIYAAKIHKHPQLTHVFFVPFGDSFICN